MTKKNNSKKFSLFLNRKFDYSILIITLALLCLGLIMLLSASTPTSLSENGTSYNYVVKQGALAIVGLVALFVLSKIDYRIYKKFKWVIYIVLIALLVLVGFIGIGENGAKRWISIFGFSFQPSEFAKVGFIIFYAAILSDIKEKGKIKKITSGFLYPLVFFIPIGISIYVLQNHFSATFIIAAITCVQMFVAGSLLRYFLCFGGVGITAILGYFFFMSLTGANSDNFRMGRIQTWLNIESDLTGTGWQINQSLYAIGSGGMFGVGLGKSKQKYLYLPEPHNDFIFAVLAEELGFVGCIAVIALFALFVWRGIVIAIKAEDNFGTLIAIGVTTMIGLQALVNIAVVTNTIPVTGMPLPFFSYGGSAMLADLMAVGILLSVSRNSRNSNNS